MPKCRGCGANITFLKTATGKMMPVDAGKVMSNHSFFDPVIHRSHFADCPADKTFRGANKIKKAVK